VRTVARAFSRLYGDALARASGLILVTSIVTALLGFGYWVLAARSYQSSVVGTAAVSVSMMTLASLVSTLGTTAAPVQRIPLRTTSREWNLTVTVSLLVSALAGAAAGVIGWAILLAVVSSPALRAPSYLAAIALGVAFTNLGMVLDSVWVVERLTHWRLLTNTLTSIAKIPLLVLPLSHMQGAAGIQWGWTASVGLGVCTGIILLIRRRHYRLVLGGLWPELYAMRRSMVGNHVMSVGASAPTYVVPVLVGALVSSSETAYFYAAWRIGSLFFLAASSVSNALFAEGARAAASAVRRAQRAILVVVPVLFAVTALMVLAGPALLSAYGAAYRARALGLLLLLIVAAVPDAITAVYRTVLRIGGQYVQGGVLMWGLALIQVALTWPLVLTFGITGAGVAWLIAETVGVVIASLDRILHGDLAARAETRVHRREGQSASATEDLAGQLGNADELLR
jgi:O-antigen/teichoic acid export membrane protein